MNRKTREHIERLEATLEMRNEYIAEQNETIARLKKELAECAEVDQIKVYDDSDVEQTLRDTVIAVAEEVRKSEQVPYFGTTVTNHGRYTPMDLMGAVAAYAVFKAMKS